MNPEICFVDVDETFVRSVGTKRIPMPATLAFIRKLKSEGAILWCWSSGGADYARQSAEGFGIADCFEGFLPKPTLILDDQEVADWKLCRTVHPAQCGNESEGNR